MFRLEKGVFDAILDPAAGTDTTQVCFNCDQTFLATTVADNSRVLWLWQPEHPDPHTIIVFENSIRQILWHPRRPDVLLVTIAQRLPVVHIWYGETKPPTTCTIPLGDPSPTRFDATWLPQEAGGRSPLLLTSAKAFNVGLIEAQGDAIVFDSLLQRHEAFGLEDENEMADIDTPSRPSRQNGAAVSTNFGSSLNTHGHNGSKW